MFIPLSWGASWWDFFLNAIHKVTHKSYGKTAYTLIRTSHRDTAWGRPRPCRRHPWSGRCAFWSQELAGVGFLLLWQFPSNLRSLKSNLFSKGLLGWHLVTRYMLLKQILSVHSNCELTIWWFIKTVKPSSIWLNTSITQGTKYDHIIHIRPLTSLLPKKHKRTSECRSKPEEKKTTHPLLRQTLRNTHSSIRPSFVLGRTKPRRPPDNYCLSRGPLCPVLQRTASASKNSARRRGK